MGDGSTIEWTEATWNPLTGCSVASPGCDHCYAAREASGRLKNQAAYTGLAIRNASGHGEFTGEVRLLPDRLDQPLRWQRPRLIFANSMADLFHPEVPTDYIAQVVAVMARARRHTFQVLTKRPKRMRLLLNSPDFVAAVRALVPGGTPWPLSNVWWGVSVEGPDYLWRLNDLAQTDAAVRWVSVEPLLDGIDPWPWLNPAGFAAEQGDPSSLGASFPALDWVVVGGESGRDARPMHPGWARLIRDQCAAVGVPFLFKQWGEWAPCVAPGPTGVELINLWSRGFDRAPMAKLGKKAAGRLLDGVAHDGYPVAA